MALELIVICRTFTSQHELMSMLHRARDARNQVTSAAGAVRWIPENLTVSQLIATKTGTSIIHVANKLNGGLQSPSRYQTMEFIQQALDHFPMDSTPILLGDLNINLATPTMAREIKIATLIASVGLLMDMLPHGQGPTEVEHHLSSSCLRVGDSSCIWHVLQSGGAIHPDCCLARRHG